MPGQPAITCPSLPARHKLIAHKIKRFSIFCRNMYNGIRSVIKPPQTSTPQGHEPFEHPMKRTKIRNNLLFVNIVIITVALSLSVIMYLNQLQGEALNQARKTQETALKTFWQLLLAKGSEFRIVDNKLMAGSYVINGNYELPDKIREIFGGTATIFMGDLRVSTNVPKEDGSRAVGTKLVGPAYDAIFIKQGNYRGEAPILGTPYFTAYDPIRDTSGKVIGILYVGIKKSEFLATYDKLQTNFIIGTIALGTLLIILAWEILRERGKAEERLHHLVDQTQLITDSVPAAIAYVDTALRYQFANRSYCHLISDTDSPPLGRSIPEVLHEAEFANREDNITRVLAGEEVSFTSIVHRDRREVHLQTTYLPHRSESGSIVGFFIQHHDITDLVMAKEAMRQSEERYRTVFNTTGTATFMIEEDGIISLANEEVFRLSGYRRDEIEGKMSWTIFVAPADQERLMEYRRQRLLDPDFPPKEYECDVVRADGSQRTGSIHVAMIPGTHKIIASFLDISERKTLERSLTHQLAFLQTLIDTIPNPIFYKDRDGCYLGNNRAFEEFIGIPADVLRGKTAYDIAPPDLADKYFAMDEALFTNPGVQSYESSVVYADGSRHQVIFSKATFNNSDGEIGGLVGVILDVTEQKRTESALAERESFLANILDCIQDGICIFDTELRVIRTNPVIARLFAASGELVGKHCYEAFHDKNEPCASCPALETLQGGKPAVKTLSRAEDGKEIWLEIHTFPLYDSGRTTITGVIEYTRDITERKRVEDSLIAAEGQFRALVEQSMVGVYIIQDGVFVYVNPKMSEIFGYSREELSAGMSHLELTAAEDRPRAMENVRKRVSGEIKSLHYEFRGLRKDGSQNRIEVFGTGTLFRGRPAVIGTLLDITDRKRMEDELHAAAEHYLTVFETAGSAMIIVEADTTISQANKEFYRLTGYDRDAVKGKLSWVDVVASADRERMLGYHRQRRIDPDAAPATYEFKLVDREGRVRDILTSVAMIPGSDRSVQSYLDITGLKQTERVLAGEKETLEMMVTDTPLADVLMSLCRNVERHTFGALCSILLVDDTGSSLRHAAAPSLPEEYNRAVDGTRIGMDIGSCGTAARTGEAVIASDIATDPRWAKYRKLPLSHGLRACWSQPIVSASGAILGTFATYYTQVRSPDNHELYLTERAAHLASIVIERQRATDALRQLQVHQRAILDNIPDLVWLKDRENRYLIANRALAAVCNLLPEEIVGKGDQELFPADLAEKYRLDDNAVMKSGNQVRMEEHFTSMSGRRRWVETIKMPVYNRNGELLGTTGIARDINERKRAERELLESEERFHNIFDQNEDAIILFRLDNFAMIDANPAALQLFGYGRSELLDQLPYAMIDGNDFQELIDEISMDGEATTFQLDRSRGHRRDGTEISIVIRASILRLRDEYVVHCSIRDISDKIRMEEEINISQAKLIQANKMTSLGMLSSSVAHEINNPNNCIAVNSTILADVWRDAEPILRRYADDSGDFPLRGLPFSRMQTMVPRLLHGITEGSGRITAIVDNMRQFVREEKGGKKGPIDVNKLVENATSILWHHIHKYTNKFVSSLGEGLPSALGHGQQVEQVIINLLMNSLQALPDRNRGVSIATSHDRHTERIVLVVQDEGVGMEQSVIDRLSEPFFTTKMESGGTGLGLYISSSIIKEHHGTMEFSSAPGIGTTVTVTLPLA